MGNRILSVKRIVKKIQTSIISYVVLVLNVLSRNYVRVGYESPVCVVPICYVSTDRVWGTVWWRSVKEAVVRVRWGVPSCTNICFPTSYIVVVVSFYFSVKFRCFSCSLPCLYSSTHYV